MNNLIIVYKKKEYSTQVERCYCIFPKDYTICVCRLFFNFVVFSLSVGNENVRPVTALKSWCSLQIRTKITDINETD